MSGSPPERQPKRQWRVEDRPSPFPRHSVPAVAVRLAQPDRGEWDDEGGLQALREELAALHSLTGGSGMRGGFNLGVTPVLYTYRLLASGPSVDSQDSMQREPIRLHL